MEITLAKGETKSVLGLTLTNTGGGHKILKSGEDESFSMIEFVAEGIETKTIGMCKAHKERGDVYFGLYHVIVLGVGRNGNIVRLSIEYIHTGITLTHNESKTVLGLTLTNTSGGHDIFESGEDTSFSMIELRANEVETKMIRVSQNDIEGVNIYFGSYHITVLDVGRDGDVIKLSVEMIKFAKIR